MKYKTLFFLTFPILVVVSVVAVNYFPEEVTLLNSVSNKIENVQPAFLSTSKPLDILFTGDIMLARHVEKLMEREGVNYPLANIKFDSSLDYLVGNFEGSIPKVHHPTASFTFSFSVPESSLTLLENHGFTHLSLANNHSYDFGASNFLHTKSVIDKTNIKSFGDQVLNPSTTVTYINHGKDKIALIGIYAVYRIPDQEKLKQIFSEANTKAGQQIVYVHWGEEYELQHSANQEALATEWINLGADLIIGHHPHVVQDIQIINGKLVLYSLGNFIFDQYFSEDVQMGLLVKLTKSKKEEQIELLPVSSMGSLSSPYYMNPADKDNFLQALAKRSDPRLTPQILAGILDLKGLSQ